MTWSLGYLPPREPELLDALFLSAGRSLHLANAFEKKCRWMVRCINLIEMHESGVEFVMDGDLITNLPPDKMLANTLNHLTGKISSSDEIMAVLRQATKARNFIAHEGASVGNVSAAGEKEILAHARRLRSAVLELADGDNIVSQWGFHFEEPRQSPPKELIDSYPQLIDQWVFGHFGDLLDEELV
ncbi:hypothetical protein OG393_35015 (plasmid) [Streptomyces sp. NBC_01216]|uniref:hypothetical protein n=1 Tax=Streptomyces sp. NBC_01216 TaxID=2903778 RepID=UPI002E0E560C|nr:hypothetical protein OG393_35015 [Streptomyces sp. NBC_01216]